MTDSKAAFARLTQLIAQLRDPVKGCPWDREQDHRSLRPYLLEEAYEAMAAIDAEDPRALCDELGDVLLQVVLHAQIASETDEFDIADVIRALSEKLIRRHPHVFGKGPADADGIREQWNEIKRRENRPSHPLPPLIEARRRMDAKGAGWKDPQFAKADAELAAGGHILWAVKACWDLGYEPEMALRKVLDAMEDSQEDAR